VSFAVPMTLPERDDAHPAVASVWARARIAGLSRSLLHARDAGGEAADLRERITTIALEHHLMSPYTAFVAVDTTRVTAGGRGAEVAVPVEVPEGVRAPRGLAGAVMGIGSGVGYGYGGLGASTSVVIVDLHTIERSSPRADVYRASPVVTGYGRADGMLPTRVARVPEVIPGQAVVRGSLDKEMIRRVIRRHANQVKHCYDLELQKDHKLEDRLVLRLTIAADGHVSAAEIVEADQHNLAIGACLTGLARDWSFPAVRGGGDTIVSYPYVFTRAQPIPYAERRE